MITIYDLLEIEEDATKEEVEEAYSKILYKYRQDPSFSEETNKENEMIVNKIKIAYEILSDDEKRKKYDSDLSKKRAESLLKGLEKNVEEKQEEAPQVLRPKVRENVDNTDAEDKPIKTKEEKKEEYDFDDGDVHKYDSESINEDDVELTAEEQEKLRKAAQEEFQKNLIKAKKAEEEYKKAYAEAYDDYMNKNKYVSNQSMTLRKFITIFVSIVVIFLVLFIAVHLPPVKEAMNNLYEENVIIKTIVDMFKNF